MLLFHGTTLNRFLKALKEGYLGTNNSIWDVSEAYTTYFYGEDSLRQEYGDNPELIKMEGIRRALESASISLSTERKNLRRVVLVLDSKDLLGLEGEFSRDNSCGESSDTWQFKGKIPIELIKEIYVDRENLDNLLLVFIGLAHRITAFQNKFNANVVGYDRDLDIEVLEASVKLLEALEDYFQENLLDVNSLRLFTLKEFLAKFGEN